MVLVIDHEHFIMPAATHTPHASLTTPVSPPAARGRDAVVRLTHWVLAVAAVGAWFTSEMDGWRGVHMSLGYTAAGALMARLVWALTPWGGGLTRWFRMALDMWKGLLGFVSGRVSASALGTQSLGVTVVLLMLLVTLTVSLGVGLDLGSAALEDTVWGDALEEIHEVLGNALFMVALGHLGVVLALSVLRRRMLALDLVRSDGQHGARAWLVRGVAALLVLVLAGFWSQRWLTHGPDAASGHERVQDHHDDDAHED